MVNLADDRDTPEKVAAFMEDNSYEFPLYYDSAYDAAYTYGIYSIPVSLFIDADGNLCVLGRKKNAIHTSQGTLVFPEELEPMLTRSPYVKECAVIGLKLDSRKHADITAVVFPDYIYSREVLGVYSSRPMVREKLTAAINELNSHLPSYKRITRLVLLDEEIPKNSYKKIIRQTLPEYVIREYIELGR